MITLLTGNSKLYMYSHMTFSYYMHLYYNSSSNAFIPRLPAKRSSPSFLSIHSTFNSTLWSGALHHAIQRQKGLPDTHRDCHAELDRFSQEGPFKSHCSLHISL